MTIRAGVRGWFRLRPRSADRIADQVDDEIALHIELRTQDLIARGVPASAARAEAEHRFGRVERARLILRRAATRRERRMTIREWLAGWAQDFRYSARALSRERLLALVIVLTLALGLGANTVMFGIIDHLLLRGPAHIASAEQVQRVYVTQNQFVGRGTTAFTGYITYTLLRDAATSIAGAAAYRVRDGRLGRGEATREVPVGWSTADMFPLLGVRPHVGRFYTLDEDRPDDAAQVAVLGYAFWQSEYGGSTAAIGRTVVIGDVQYEIIGVTPPAFTGPELTPVSVWLPMSTGFKPRPDWQTTWRATWLNVIVRTRADVAPELADAEATSLYRAAAEGHSSDAAEGVLSLRPLRYGHTGEEVAEASIARWLLGVSIIVLLIAAANVTNLLLARLLRRRREVSVRLALGISRARLTRLLVSESLLLALAGLAGALAIAYWGGQAVRHALLPDVQWRAALDARTLAFSVAAALLTGLVIGLAPALHSARQDLMRGLRTSAGDGGVRGARARGALTVLQAALSVVLLVGAGLFVRSLWNVSTLDLGIDTDRLLAVWVEFAPSADETGHTAFWNHAIEQLRAQPDVEHAVIAVGTPFQAGMGVTLRVPGRDSIPELPGGGPFITAAAPGYFEAVGTRIVRGRGFEAGEGRGTEPIVVVGQTMAQTLWPGEDALTKCLIIGSPDAACARVVGIAQDAHRSGIRREPLLQYYVPLGQETNISGSQLVVRPRGNAAAYIPALRRLLYSLDPGVTYLAVNPLQQQIDPQVRPWRLGATMFLVFGSLALLIAAVGLYSVMAYGVVQRRTEIGVRKALGARTRSIVGMIVRQGVGLVVVGMILGTAVALAAGPMLEPLLFETASRDAAVIAVVGVVLAAVAVLASVVPAVRAGRTDPLSALRAD